jgi:sulfoacetaldehyde dehydrogenase
MEKVMTPEQQEELEVLVEKGRKALKEIEKFDQDALNKLCQAAAWAVASKKAFAELSEISVKETGIGTVAARMIKREKIKGVLRDVLRGKSVGIIKEIPEKGLTLYAKPAGLIASPIPMTNPIITPAGIALNTIKARDAVIFLPHPRAKKSIYATVERMRQAIKALGGPEDILQCVQNAGSAINTAAMKKVDLIIATGPRSIIHDVYSSGTPGYGNAPGNVTVIYDETADLAEAARYTRMSKTKDNGSGCSADSHLLIYKPRYKEAIAELQKQGGYLATNEEREAFRRAMYDEEGHRIMATFTCPAVVLAKAAGVKVPENTQFIMVEGGEISPDNQFCKNSSTTLLSLFTYDGPFSNAVDIVRRLLAIEGRGHSVGINSTNDKNINELALGLEVTRVLVRQPHSLSNAGAFYNGLPMTSTLSSGTWAGNIVSENICLKHYLNTTWVSRRIPIDKPSDSELFGEFYDKALEEDYQIAEEEVK